MWSYFGSKTTVVDYYPRPRYPKIIEPFAGTAKYSLKYFDREVLLVDKYEKLIRVWQWLQKCSEKDILDLPRLKFRDKVTDFDLGCIEAQWFVGFLCNKGSEKPRISANSWVTTLRPNWFNHSYKSVASNLYKIRHWEINLGTYEDIPNQEATHFIDPPYQFGGESYIESNKKIDFNKLGPWCKERMGQVIVCENTKATWIDLKPVASHKGRSKVKNHEAIWTNEPSIYDNEQLLIPLT